VMAAGIIVFLLTMPMLAYFGIDTDIIGLIIFTTGLAVLLIGIIRRYRLHGWKLIILLVIVILLFLPVLQLMVSLVYYLITKKPLGG
jgi:hypothetical protein